MNGKPNKSNWREIEEAKQKHHKQVIMILDVVIAVCVLGYIWLGINIVQMYLPKHGEYVYNCSVAEIHPDFTPATQRACRKQFKKETQNDL